MPVVIRGGASDWPAATAWTVDGLRQRAGKKKVASASTPYAAELGITDGVRQGLSKFLRKMRASDPADVADGVPPQYVFDRKVADKLGDAFIAEGFTPTATSPFFGFAHVGLQFMVGPAGSGAPPQQGPRHMPWPFQPSLP